MIFFFLLVFVFGQKRILSRECHDQISIFKQINSDHRVEDRWEGRLTWR